MGRGQRLLCCPQRERGHGKARGLGLGFYRPRKAAVLGQRGVAHALHGQQAVLPFALEEQALLRAVAQVALVILPAPGHAAAQAQFFEQILHLARIVTRHGQVMRALRAGHAVDAGAPAVATGLVFQLQQCKVVHPRQPGAGFEQVAQLVAAGHVDARKAALQRARRPVATRQQHARGGRGGGGGKEEAALHGRSVFIRICGQSSNTVQVELAGACWGLLGLRQAQRERSLVFADD